MSIELILPLSAEQISGLQAGMNVKISGIIYTARDQAHARMCRAVKENRSLPFPLQNAFIFYAGPAPSRDENCGPIGPTTSCRIDGLTVPLLENGLKGMIGKGKRSAEIIEACIKYHAVYFAAIGGAASYLARCVKSHQVVAYDDLGTEAVRLLSVENFPAVVAIDTHGNSIY